MAEHTVSSKSPSAVILLIFFNDVAGLVHLSWSLQATKRSHFTVKIMTVRTKRYLCYSQETLSVDIGGILSYVKSTFKCNLSEEQVVMMTS